MRFTRHVAVAVGMVVLGSIVATGAARAVPVASPSRIVVRMAELEIDPDQRADYDRLLAEEIETSVRVEPGVLSLNAMSVKGKPGSVRIMEVYADQAAYEAHIRSPHFLKYKTGTTSMVRSLVLIEGEPIALRTKAGGAKPARQISRALRHPAFAMLATRPVARRGSRL